MTLWNRWLSGPARLMALAALPLCMAPAGGALADDGPDVFGWVEMATLEPWDVEVKAKLDSGALTSSLDARDIERFDKEESKDGEAAENEGSAEASETQAD